MSEFSVRKKKSVLHGSHVDGFMRAFFSGNALLSVVILVLITIFLFKEGIGFFPQNLRNLRVYRLAGLEYVDFMRVQVEDHTALSRYLQNLRQRQIDALLKQGKSAEDASTALAGFDRFTGEFDDAIDPLRTLVSDLTETATTLRDKAKILEEGGNKSAVDFVREIQPLRATFPAYEQASAQLRSRLESLLTRPPTLPSHELQPRVEKFRQLIGIYVAGFPAVEAKLKAWDPQKPVPLYRAATSLLFGREWITGGFFQDWYGAIPLVVGSVLVSFVALMIAVPLSVCCAVYVSELASLREQRFIKPCLEFIAAIPSVVLGFFGIAVLGETIRWITQLHFLSWVPFFPISERLNIFTAGALLALMAVPTIFSLSEDALNNVPRAFKEASLALGATRLQTIIRVLIPASLSGIVSAVLLGFGRVIGETMVVLLCAGNRIAIPDFAQGIGVFFQPVHTMTGIIAQEMGEVVRGSVHYRALFMVGVLLFFLALLINWAAQFIVRRFKISID